MVDYISLEEFACIAGVSESTIKRNRENIPGVVYSKRKYKVLSGTRYPCDIHRYKIKDSADRRYVLLKMISEYRYITNLDLQLYHEQFVEMLRELLSAGLIKENSLPNHYGANAYDCTEKGDKLLHLKKVESTKQITDLVASAAGTFVGKVISEVAA